MISGPNEPSEWIAGLSNAYPPFCNGHDQFFTKLPFQYNDDSESRKRWAARMQTSLKCQADSERFKCIQQFADGCFFKYIFETRQNFSWIFVQTNVSCIDDRQSQSMNIYRIPYHWIIQQIFIHFFAIVQIWGTIIFRSHGFFNHVIHVILVIKGTAQGFKIEVKKNREIGDGERTRAHLKLAPL